MSLHQRLFGVLIFILPVQLALHFWPNWTSVWGVRIDYLAPTIYLTDILVALLLILAYKNLKIKNVFVVLLIFAFLLINCFWAQNRGAAFYKLAKIVEFFLLGIYVSRSAYSLRLTAYGLPLAVLYSSWLAIAQFVKQASLNGIFWWLGERTFNLNQPGIAKAVINGRLFLRPYAIFSHPNALAGFLLVSLILTIPYWWKKNRLFAVCYLLFAVIALIFSFSRSVWLTGAVIFFIFLLRKNSARFLLIGEAIGQRLILSQIAFQLIKLKPIFGVGLNNFIVWLPYFWPKEETVRLLQPVHNIFLLIGAETGLIGLVVFCSFLILSYRRIKSENIKLALLAILILGLFDHYWITLQQNQLLFTIILGLSWGKSSRV